MDGLRCSKQEAQLLPALFKFGSIFAESSCAARKELTVTIDLVIASYHYGLITSPSQRVLGSAHDDSIQDAGPGFRMVLVQYLAARAI